MKPLNSQNQLEVKSWLGQFYTKPKIDVYLSIDVYGACFLKGEAKTDSRDCMQDE